MRLRLASLVLLFTSSLLAGPRPAQHPVPFGARQAPADVHSWSNHSQILVQHVSLDLTVDFEQRVLTGSAELDLHSRTGATTLVLDTRGLSIHEVTYGDGSPAPWALGTYHPILGSPLTITVTAGTRSVAIHYTTSPAASALNWLTPAQTTDQRNVFLYTQNEPISARDWIPAQDTPQTRVTYDAKIRVPPGLLALMSAENPTEIADDGIYSFRMRDPVPLYLIALAVGELEYQPLASNIGVYSEPSRAAMAAYEVGEASKMMAAAERLFGPYRWGRYDVLVLPHTYQVGGMEHARLTFVHPYFLSGDHTLNTLLAHELAHSWAGNLVTLATWNDVWLNEGITTYIERRIMEEVYGRELEEILADNAMRGLRNLITQAPKFGIDTRLHLDLSPLDHPLEPFNSISYQKGWAFMRMLEERIGRDTLDGFLREYFRQYAWNWMDSDGFIEAFRRIVPLTDEAMAELALDEWIYAAGLPSNAPVISSPRLRQVEGEIQRFMTGAPAASLDKDKWNNLELAHFLNYLPITASQGRMQELESAFSLNANQHRSVAAAWLWHVVRARWSPGYAALEVYLTTTAAHHFYQELLKTSDGAQLARAIYSRVRERYHPWDQSSLDALMGQGQYLGTSATEYLGNAPWRQTPERVTGLLAADRRF